jgi:hypothetical protein
LPHEKRGFFTIIISNLPIWRNVFIVMERKYAQFFDLVNRAELLEAARLGAISSITGGRTSSLKELSPGEYNELCNWAKKVEKDKNGAMRGRIIFLLCEMNYKDAEGFPDWAAINRYVAERCGEGNPKKKVLHKLKWSELRLVTTQIEQYYKVFKASALKKSSLAE